LDISSSLEVTWTLGYILREERKQARGFSANRSRVVRRYEISRLGYNIRATV
jgi:hypothetical protein